VADSLRQGQPGLRRAQQDLGRAERACGEHHQVRADELLWRAAELLALTPGVRETDLPFAVHALFDAVHQDLTENAGAVVVGVRQIVHGRGVLGADVAPRHAVPAQVAVMLRHADVVASGEVLEVDVDGREHERGAQRVRRALQRGQLRERDALLVIGSGLEHRLRARVAIQQALLVLDQRPGPDRVLEHARVGTQGDVGVDQRRTAEPTAADHVDVGVHVHVEEPGRFPDQALGGVELELVERLGRGVRELTGQKFLAALQQAHGLPGSCQARRQDAAAVTAADHHHAVVGFEVAEGKRQSPVFHVVLDRLTARPHGGRLPRANGLEMRETRAR
jgi:hypothetical protein